MKVKFHKIENMVSTPGHLFNLQLVGHECDASFSSSVVAGDAFLKILEPLHARGFPEVALNRDVEVELSIEGETEITDLESTDALPESIRPLGLRGHFEIIAHLLNHSRSIHFRNTPGPELSACDFSFFLWASKFPPGSLEIAPGNLVRIRTQKLTFVTWGTVGKNFKKEDAIETIKDLKKEDKPARKRGFAGVWEWLCGIGGE